MANVNTNAPSGFKHYQHANGGIPGRTSRYFIASGLASDLFMGDALIPVGTNKNVNVATAGVRLIGVFNGCLYQDNVKNPPTWARRWPTGTTLKTGTMAEAYVFDDPNDLFEVQGSGIVAQADIGALADLTAATAGNANTGTSGQQLDTTTITSGTVFRINEFVDRPDNFIGIANDKVLVRIALHYLAGGMTAI